MYEGKLMNPTHGEQLQTGSKLVVMQAREWPSENSNCKSPKKAGGDSDRIRAIL
jgi:hypothetical protein